jgi:hypothetical protein
LGSIPVFLYLIGSVIGIAGYLALGFSITIRDFSLGNSLIGAGATALVGGLILFGLGAAIRELRRLGRAIEKQNQGLGQAQPQAEMPKPARSSRVTGPIPVTVPMPSRIPQQNETDDEPLVPANERRPSIFAVVRGNNATEHFEIDETNDVPHSPPVAPRAPERAVEPELERPRVEPRVTSPSAIASRAAARLDMPRVAPEPEPEPAPRAERPSRNLFDTVWPTEQKQPEPAPPVRAERNAERPMFAPPDENEPSRDPFDLAHAAVKEALVAEERPPARAEPKLNLRSEPRMEARPEPKTNATILKSGVIDGMAYTLYTDGSIEAQLPDGVMRFASIDDLRAYLERGA